MSKANIAIGVLALLLLAGITYLFTSNDSGNRSATTLSPEPTADTNSNQTASSANPFPDNNASPGTISSATPENISTTTITYNADGTYSPASLTVSPNTKVTFVNKS